MNSQSTASSNQIGFQSPNSSERHFDLMQALKDYKTINTTSVQIDNSQLINKVDSYFQCKICERLVAPPTPIECASCQQLFCLSCVLSYAKSFFDLKQKMSLDNKLSQESTCSERCECTEHQKTNNSCQRLSQDSTTSHQKSSCVSALEQTMLNCFHCKKQLRTQTLHHYSSYILNQNQLHCTHKGCSVQVPYSDYVTHIKELCEFQPILCKCGQTVTKKIFSEHKKTSCMERLVKCKKCELYCKAKEIMQNTHCCVSMLKKRNFALEVEVTKAKSQVEELSNRSFVQPTSSKRQCLCSSQLSVQELSKSNQSMKSLHDLSLIELDGHSLQKVKFSSPKPKHQIQISESTTKKGKQNSFISSLVKKLSHCKSDNQIMIDMTDSPTSSQAIIDQDPAQNLKKSNDSNCYAENLLKSEKMLICTQEDVTCKKCQADMIEREPFYWKCKDEDCNYTLCHFCAFEN
eukprot:403374517